MYPHRAFFGISKQNVPPSSVHSAQFPAERLSLRGWCLFSERSCPERFLWRSGTGCAVLGKYGTAFVLSVGEIVLVSALCLSCGAVLLLGCQSEVLFAWYCSVSSSTVNFTLWYLRGKAGSHLGELVATSAVPGWVNSKMLLQEPPGSTTATDSRCGDNWVKMPPLHFLLPGNLAPASSTYPSQCFQWGKDQLEVPKFWFFSVHTNPLFFLSDSSAHVSVFNSCPHHPLSATSRSVCTCTNTRGGEAAHEMNITRITFSRKLYCYWDIKLY